MATPTPLLLPSSWTIDAARMPASAVRNAPFAIRSRVVGECRA
ncbi:hypothetical protein [Streptomyces avicenniae]|nr:hypothetical protein [Streptomyces avicenniae]